MGLQLPCDNGFCGWAIAAVIPKGFEKVAMDWSEA
jgi:hypothetical protein